MTYYFIIQSDGGRSVDYFNLETALRVVNESGGQLVKVTEEIIFEKDINLGTVWEVAE